MDFKKWLKLEIALNPNLDSSNHNIIISRLQKIISLSDNRRGDMLKDLAGPRQSMDEVYEDVYETALQMFNVLKSHDLHTARPVIDTLYKRYKRIVEEKSTQKSDLHTSWENYRKFFQQVDGWLFSIWEMVEDVFKGKRADEENYGKIT